MFREDSSATRHTAHPALDRDVNATNSLRRDARTTRVDGVHGAPHAINFPFYSRVIRIATRSPSIRRKTSPSREPRPIPPTFLRTEFNATGLRHRQRRRAPPRATIRRRSNARPVPAARRRRRDDESSPRPACSMGARTHRSPLGFSGGWARGSVPKQARRAGSPGPAAAPHDRAEQRDRSASPIGHNERSLDSTLFLQTSLARGHPSRTPRNE